MHKNVKKVIGALMAMIVSFGTIGLGTKTVTAATGNLIQNPNFTAEGDLNAWSAAKGGAKITAEVGEENIFGGVKTYGKISGRTSNYDCFAQDVTAVIENNVVYEYTFYVKLDETDYNGTTEAMRTIEVSPFITVNGNTVYSQGVAGTTRKAVNPGEWTKFTGTYTPSWTGDMEQAAIRILEQGLDYGQGDGIKGSYYITGVQLVRQDTKNLLIDTEVVDLRDAVQAQMDEDFIVGCSIGNGDLSDINVMALVTKHFNALTLGNELKPDAMFGYSNNVCPGKETVKLNGEEIEVPKMDYSRAEKTLDYIWKWNQDNPDQKIRIRGHVLVWHGQTPEWWFHEDYDAKKPYADIETMNKRLEWYIKTMAEHFTGKNSKYRGMFYGWDVVNEAISDGGARYRNSGENSIWWAIYGSNEFIINAFRFANKYMDSSVELYYNDYNEFSPTKREGIVKLLTDVKEAKGTRIDGMGMQGHYGTGGNPSMQDFADSARAFASVVGKVQVTELDMGATDNYDGSPEMMASEYSMQAYRYKDLFDTIKELRKEGIHFTNITWWGVVDKYSWLQTSNSAGGGSKVTRRQCPLLFDDDYQVKPAFWAFADDTKLKPAAKQISIVQAASGSMKGASEITFSGAGTDISFQPVWGDKYLLTRVFVKDTEPAEGDRFILYVSADGKEIQKKEILREKALKSHKGYESAVKVEIDPTYLKLDGDIRFDLVVYNNGESVAYSDRTFSQDTTTEYYAHGKLIGNATVEQEKKDEEERAAKRKAKEEADAAKAAEAAEGQNETPVEPASPETTVEDAAESSGNWLFVGIGAAVVGAVFGVGIYYRLKKRTRK